MMYRRVLFGAVLLIMMVGLSGAQEWSSMVQPSSRCGANMIYDAENRRMVMFAGENSRLPWGDHHNDVWVLYGDVSTGRWERLSPQGSPPSFRARSMAIYDSSAQRMVIFGGMLDFINYFDEVYVLDLESGSERWEEIEITGDSPSPRSNGSAIYDGFRQRMIVFGGDSDAQPLNDLWSLDLVSFEWTELTPSGTPPAPRRAHRAIYDAAEDRMIVFAGGGDAGLFNDTWSLSLEPGSESWTELTTTGEIPGARKAHVAVWDQSARRLYTVGGQASSAYPENVFYLDLGSLVWTKIVVLPKPPGRRGVSGAFDYHNGTMVIFGGNRYPDYYFDDTHAFAVPTVGIEAPPDSPTPLVDVVFQSYPNPANGNVTISYEVPERCTVSLKIFDAVGRLVRVLVESEMEPGRYTDKWDRKDSSGEDLPNGIYFYTFTAGELVSAKKMILLR